MRTQFDIATNNTLSPAFRTINVCQLSRIIVMIEHTRTQTPNQLMTLDKTSSLITTGVTARWVAGDDVLGGHVL